MKLISNKKAAKERLLKKAPLFASWGVVLVSLVITIWVTFEMVQFSLEAKFADPGAKPPAPVLVNLEHYDLVADRIQKSRAIKPEKISIPRDPFKAAIREAVPQ